MAAVAKPGHFNDPDMLQVGNVGLTVTEQYSHMSLWSIVGAPLLAGTDLINADATTLAILANKEVTAVNQDLGKDGAVQGVLMHQLLWRREVWRKELADGRVAIVALNTGNETASISVEWSDVFPPALPAQGGVVPAKVRDLWAKKDSGPLAASGSQMTCLPMAAAWLQFGGRKNNALGENNQCFFFLFPISFSISLYVVYSMQYLLRLPLLF